MVLFGWLSSAALDTILFLLFYPQRRGEILYRFVLHVNRFLKI